MLNRRAALMMAVGLVAVLAVAACGDSSTDEPAAENDAGASFTSADGAELYAQGCASCHGADLMGTDQGPPFLDAVYEPGHHGDASFFLAVARGTRAHHWNFGNMPPIEGLSDEQVSAIVAFVRARQAEAGIN